MSALLLRLAAWLYVVALVLMTLGPTRFRPETAMSPLFEHLAAFCFSGLLFVVGYRTHRMLLVLWGGTFAVLLEFLQIWAPGRHPRMIDLTMDASGFWIGLAVGFILLRGLGNARKRYEPAG